MDSIQVDPLTSDYRHRTISFCLFRVNTWPERRKVAGSNPAADKVFFFLLAVEFDRKT